MELLKEKRRLKRTDITKTVKHVNSSIQSMDVASKRQYLGKLQSLLMEIKDLDDKIFDKLFEANSKEGAHDAEFKTNSEYETKLVFAISMLQPETEPTPQPPDGSVARGNLTKLKLPQIPLPEYGHREGEDLTKFLANFEQIINKYSLTEYEKFVYLKGQLFGDPLILIKSLETANQNYGSAKDLLKKAFASPATQQFDAIARLAALKFGRNEDPYEYISKVRLIVESFQTLEINADIVLQYFVWTGMNNDMRSQFVNITNENKPSLALIQQHMFTATERYKNLRQEERNVVESKKSKRPALPSEQVATAAAVKHNSRDSESASSSPYCALCSEEDNKVTSHMTSKCDKYSTAKQKIDRLLAIKGCVKCGNRQHTADKCRFRFRKPCFQCSKYHFHYLCTTETKSGKDNKPKENETTNASNKSSSSSVKSGAVYIGQTAAGHFGEDAIIPTFSVRFRDNSVLRGARDSGCQPNFITDDAAARLKLKVVRSDFAVNVSGFNSTTNHETKVVQLKIEEKNPPIYAICVPKIKIKLPLPDLDKCVQGFLAKGYEMADEFLLTAQNEISDLDFILGNCDGQCLPQTEVTFGNGHKSLYSVTQRGIMLNGNVQRYMKNMDQLPLATAKSPPTPVPTITSDTKESQTDTVMSHGIGTNTEEPELPLEFASFKVAIDTIGNIPIEILDVATDQICRIDQYPNLNYDEPYYPDISKEDDEKLSTFALDNTQRTSDGRLVMPLLWNDKVSHLLGSNIKLSQAVLKSNINRLKSQPEKLELYDEAIKSHVSEGVLQPIDNMQQYIEEHPNVSFLPHMGVFRLDHQSTKCRIVLLSNLSEKTLQGQKIINHNQAICAGPNLNKKISTAVTKLRFDKFLLCFDIRKAFLNIVLRSIDQDKLLIHWFRNVKKKDFTVVAFRYTRLPFGLRCSPAILMLALYKILIVDTETDSDDLRQLKKLIYDLIYMDNGAVTSNDEKYLELAFATLNKIFNPYKFSLQQFFTNSNTLQNKINETNENCAQSEVKLLGLKYNRTSDTLAPPPLQLDSTADTKRKILSTIASNYDVLQINGPLINRARLFVHKLQCDSELEWDEKISDSRIKEWINICKQVMSSPPIVVNRHVGCRSSDYELVAFTDASKFMLGIVIYIKDRETGHVNFLQAKNRIVTRQLETKSMPSLELHALSLGVSELLDCYQELTDETSVVRIKISQLSLYCDSMVALCWLNSFSNKLDKMQNRSPFIMNRLAAICRAIEVHPVQFHFIEGKSNPADVISRPTSYKQLMQSSYISGPSFLRNDDLRRTTDTSDSSFTVPCVWSACGAAAVSSGTATAAQPTTQHVVPLDQYSSLCRHVRIRQMILRFINNLKQRVKEKNNNKWERLICYSPKTNSFALAKQNMILTEQRTHFAELIDFFSSKEKWVKNTPNLILQLNVFQDINGMLRVRSKFRNWTPGKTQEFPILLPKASKLTELIISDVHQTYSHAGIYSVLAALRKEFFIPQAFSTVRKILRECITCRRVNARPVKLNTSFYRDFRAEPPSIPFRYVFIDHFGPYYVKRTDSKSKVWILCITCLWSRAVNLKLCSDLSVAEFLRTFQLHVFQHGMPELVLSDLGSQIVAGAHIITDLLKSPEAQQFFQENNMKSTSFDQYPKGNSALGGLVEACVKLSKKLIHGAIKNAVLTAVEFDFIVAQTVNLINKRPVAFKETLRSDHENEQELPEPITPEILMRGYDILAMVIGPENNDEEWIPEADHCSTIVCASKKLTKVRERLVAAYNGEYLGNLIHQAVNETNRYKPTPNRSLKVGDIVLLRENNVKAMKYPMAVVKEVKENDIGEVTEVVVRKGTTRENVRRHVTAVIPLLSHIEPPAEPCPAEPPPAVQSNEGARPKRQAAVISRKKTQKMLSAD